MHLLILRSRYTVRATKCETRSTVRYTDSGARATLLFFANLICFSRTMMVRHPYQLYLVDCLSVPTALCVPSPLPGTLRHCIIAFDISSIVTLTCTRTRSTFSYGRARLSRLVRELSRVSFRLFLRHDSLCDVPCVSLLLFRD